MKNNFDTNQFSAAADRSPVDLQMVMDLVDMNVNIYGHQNRRLFAKEDLDDMRQTIKVKVWKHLGSFDSTKASLKTWVSRIVENGLKDAFNAKMRHNSFFSDPFFLNRDDDEFVPYGSYRGNEFETDRGICFKENMGHIRQSFDSLPEQYREIIYLDEEGYSTAEIADMLGSTEGRVYLLRHRAKKAYAKRLGTEFLTGCGIAA